MSHFIANAHFFDVMDQVHLSVTVTDIDEEPTSEARGMIFSTTVSGSGEGRMTEWLKDALVKLHQSL